MPNKRQKEADQSGQTRRPAPTQESRNRDAGGFGGVFNRPLIFALTFDRFRPPGQNVGKLRRRADIAAHLELNMRVTRRCFI